MGLIWFGLGGLSICWFGVGDWFAGNWLWVSFSVVSLYGWLWLASFGVGFGAEVGFGFSGFGWLGWGLSCGSC